MNKAIQGVVGAAAVGLAALVFVTGGTGSAEDGSIEVEQVGYFKSDDRDRVLAFCAQGVPTEAQAQSVFDGITTTAGRMTLAVILDCSAGKIAGDRLTLAEDVQGAMQQISNGPFSGWVWRMRVNPAGDVTIDQQGADQ